MGCRVQGLGFWKGGKGEGGVRGKGNERESEIERERIKDFVDESRDSKQCGAIPVS